MCRSQDLWDFTARHKKKRFPLQDSNFSVNVIDIYHVTSKVVPPEMVTLIFSAIYNTHIIFIGHDLIILASVEVVIISVVC